MVVSAELSRLMQFGHRLLLEPCGGSMPLLIKENFGQFAFTNLFLTLENQLKLSLSRKDMDMPEIQTEMMMIIYSRASIIIFINKVSVTLFAFITHRNQIILKLFLSSF